MILKARQPGFAKDGTEAWHHAAFILGGEEYPMVEVSPDEMAEAHKASGPYLLGFPHIFCDRGTYIEVWPRPANDLEVQRREDGPRIASRRASW